MNKHVPLGQAGVAGLTVRSRVEKEWDHVIEHVQLMVPVQAMKTKSSTVVQLNVVSDLFGFLFHCYKIWLKSGDQIRA